MQTSHGANTETLTRKVPVADAVGMALAHDITEVRSSNFKGTAFRKGHVVTGDDVPQLLRLGKDNLFVLNISNDEMHEDDAANALAAALLGDGTEPAGAPREGKVKALASRDGLLKVNRQALYDFNMHGDVMCATLHDNTVVKKGQEIAGLKAIPLVVRRRVVEGATAGATKAGGILSVRPIRKPKAGAVITGNEVYYGRIQDSFAPVIDRKIKDLGGELIGTYYAPDDAACIGARLSELLAAGADLLIVTGGMSVDPDDVSRQAIRELGASDITYGSATLPGAMFLVAYIERNDSHGNGRAVERIPVVGVPACGMYHRTTVLDVLLPRILSGEVIGRRELAELGHGGLCLNCGECVYPRCPFGK